jgi:hypothetical protein
MGIVYKGSSLCSSYGLDPDKLLGKSIKVLRRDNPTPFYFKVTGYAFISGKDEPTTGGLRGYDQEGELMGIDLVDIDFIEVE